MKICRTKLLVTVAIAAVFLPLFNFAQTPLYLQTGFYWYRIVSTQQTRIIGFDFDGNITWTNQFSNATCHVVWLTPPDYSGWSSNVPYAWINSNGWIMTVKVPIPPPSTNDVTQYITGTVQYQSFEGGFYGIVGDNSESYDPINLPAQYCQHGLRVRFRAQITDRVSFHMWGHIVELLYIEPL